MKTFDLIKKLSLHESEGWSYQPFIPGNSSTFYTEIIENNSVTLAWIAIRGTINVQDLITHHFKREIDPANGVINSLPRLLIVTDGKTWLLSKPGAEQFTQVRFSKILMAFYSEIKDMLNYPAPSKQLAKLQKRLTKSLARLMSEVRLYGESISETQNETNMDLFSGSGQTQMEIKRNIMPYVIPASNDQQLDRYSRILHQLLFKTLHLKQLQFLLKFPENDVYANPFFKKNQLLVCITKNFHNKEQEAIHHKPVFLIVDKYAGVKSYHPTKEVIEKDIVPSLLKVNRDLVNEFLTKEPF